MHLLVEARDRMALARGMQGFQKHINAAISKGKRTRRRRSVFPDRYHVEIITSRRRPSFEGWRDLGEALDVLPDSYEPFPVWHPKTWLLRDGWKLYGLIRTATATKP